jgi:hypothetical protein
VKGKVIRGERLELVDRWGRKVLELGARDSMPYAIWFDSKGNIRTWLTFNVDGTPDVRFFKSTGNDRG